MRGAPQVPQDVRKGMQALLSGRRNGLAYEDVRATARDEVAAVELWLAQARRAPTPKRRPGLAGRRSGQSLVQNSGMRYSDTRPFM